MSGPGRSGTGDGTHPPGATKGDASPASLSPDEFWNAIDAWLEARNIDPAEHSMKHLPDLEPPPVKTEYRHVPLGKLFLSQGEIEAIKERIAASRRSYEAALRDAQDLIGQ